MLKISIQCNICNSEDFEESLTINKTDRFIQAVSPKSKVNRIWCYCKKCNNAFQILPKDLASKLKKIEESYYDIDLGGGINGIKDKFNKIIRLKYNESDNYNRVQRICNIVNFSKSSLPSLLDIGTGMGVFIHYLTRNYKISVVETDPLATSHLNQQFDDIQIFQKIPKSKKYDLVTCNKVIEHIENPNSFVKEIKKCIKKNGYLYIEVPDINNLFLKKSSDNSLGPLHYNLYSKNGLSKLINIKDFNVLFFETIIEPSSKVSLIFLGKYK